MSDQQSNDSAPDATINLFLPGEAATEQFGALLMRAIREMGDGMMLYLIGELGAGKTTLSRGIIRGAGHSGAVKSPTYTLVEPYGELVPPVYHFDLYRLGDPEELEFMGIRDYLTNAAVCLVEWPQRGAGVLPAADATLTLSSDQDGRGLVCQAFSDRGRLVLKEAATALQRGWVNS